MAKQRTSAATTRDSVVQFPVGRLKYDLALTASMPVVDGQPAIGMCDTLAQRIEVWAGLSIEKRLATAWHEIGHAWLMELDPHDARARDSETICNLIAMGMAAITPATLERLCQFLSEGTDSEAEPERVE